MSNPIMELSIWLDGGLRLSESPLCLSDRWIQGFIWGMCSDGGWHCISIQSLATTAKEED